jgi:hypothetical protein
VSSVRCARAHDVPGAVLHRVEASQVVGLPAKHEFYVELQLSRTQYALLAAMRRYRRLLAAPRKPKFASIFWDTHKISSERTRARVVVVIA